MENLRDGGSPEIMAATHLVAAADDFGGFYGDGVLRVDRRAVVRVRDDKTVRGLGARRDGRPVDLRRADVNRMMPGEKHAPGRKFPKIGGRLRRDEIGSHAVPDDNHHPVRRKGLLGKTGDGGTAGEQEEGAKEWSQAVKSHPQASHLESKLGEAPVTTR